MSWLQTQTVITFHKHNPDWEIRVYIPIQPSLDAKEKYVPDYTDKDYFDIVRKLPYVTIVETDIAKYGIDPKIHNIQQSDIFRYLMLYEVGGLWMDFDVLWLRPVSDIYKIKSKGIVSTAEMGAFICKCEPEQKFHSIGVLMAKPKHPFYKTIIDKCFLILKNNIDRDKLYHQSFGTDLIDKLYPTFEGTARLFPDIVQIPYKVFYPYSIFDLESLYKKMDMDKINDKDVLCVHWFNGHRFSKDYVNNERPEKEVCSMDRIISLIKKDLL